MCVCVFGTGSIRFHFPPRRNEAVRTKHILRHVRTKMDPQVRCKVQRLFDVLHVSIFQQEVIWEALLAQDAEEHVKYMVRLATHHVTVIAHEASHFLDMYHRANTEVVSIYGRRYVTRDRAASLEAATCRRASFSMAAKMSMARLVQMMETGDDLLREKDVVGFRFEVVAVVRDRLAFRRAYLMRQFRAHVRRYHIALFWQRATVEALYAPKGAGRKRDRTEFEAWWGSPA